MLAGLIFLVHGAPLLKREGAALKDRNEEYTARVEELGLAFGEKCMYDSDCAGNMACR